MLAVVDHEQELGVAQALEHVVEQRAVRPLAHVENAGDRLDHQLRVEHRGQVDQPGAFAGLRGHPGGDLDRQPCLSRPAGARQGDQTGPAEQVRELGELPLAPDEAGELDQQVVAAGIRGSQRRKLARQIGVLELEEALGTVPVTQPVHAEVAQGRLRGEVLARELAHGRGHEDLAAMGERVDRGAAAHGHFRNQY